jgi:uncharacterized protein YbjQ (UPF0145 family)
MAKALLPVTILCASAGCTSVQYVEFPKHTTPGTVFFTAEGVKAPYESVGVIQLTRKGAHVFGFADPVGTDLETAMKELTPQIQTSGADGVANVRMHATPFTTADQILGAIFFFIPLGSQVTITGELVRLGPPRQVVVVAPQ